MPLPVPGAQGLPRALGGRRRRRGAPSWGPLHPAARQSDAWDTTGGSRGVSEDGLCHPFPQVSVGNTGPELSSPSALHQPNGELLVPHGDTTMRALVL